MPERAADVRYLVPPKRPDRPVRIALVDDDPDQIDLMTSVLADYFPAAEIRVAGSGAEVRGLDLTQVDLILLDLHLPDCTGIELLHYLRVQRDLPVIMITAERFGQTAAEAIRAGAVDYIVKHADYFNVVPAVVEKALAMAEIKANHQRLEQELLERNADLERLNEQLREMAANDPLTGLYNRRHFQELLGQLFSEAVRYSTDLTCLMMDLDNFKLVNDTQGHQIGDRVLQIVADVLRNSLRQSDLPARYGGDEFVVLLPRTRPVDARASARRIVAGFRAHLASRLPNAGRVTLSVGVASLEHGQPPSGDALVRLADHALYLAKAAGKDRIMVVNPVEVASHDGDPVV